MKLLLTATAITAALLAGCAQTREHEALLEESEPDTMTTTAAAPTTTTTDLPATTTNTTTTTTAAPTTTTTTTTAQPRIMSCKEATDYDVWYNDADQNPEAWRPPQGSKGMFLEEAVEVESTVPDERACFVAYEIYRDYDLATLTGHDRYTGILCVNIHGFRWKGDCAPVRCASSETMELGSNGSPYCQPPTAEDLCQESPRRSINGTLSNNLDGKCLVLMCETSKGQTSERYAYTYSCGGHWYDDEYNFWHSAHPSVSPHREALSWTEASLVERDLGTLGWHGCIVRFYHAVSSITENDGIAFFCDPRV